MPHSNRPRSRLVTILAVLLAVESVTVTAVHAGEIQAATGPDSASSATTAPSAAIARGLVGSRFAPGQAPFHATVAAPSPSSAAAPSGVLVAAAAARRAPKAASGLRAAVVTKPTKHAAPTSRATAPARPAARPHAAPKPRSTAKPHAAPKPRPTPNVHYVGHNHVWIPSLGISYSVYSFPCSRSREPDNLVYRWGCAGHNNVYLMGHAWGVFHALNRAYYTGRVRVGMKVYYADGSGRTHAYAVRWWRVVLPTTSASWAWASLARPSMTLQTCVGANSSHRLMVRLAQVG
ncbi:MAG: sortase domain-bontaining protein [Chloroflexota bacterium]